MVLFTNNRDRVIQAFLLNTGKCDSAWALVRLLLSHIGSMQESRCKDTCTLLYNVQCTREVGTVSSCSEYTYTIKSSQELYFQYERLVGMQT